MGTITPRVCVMRHAYECLGAGPHESGEKLEQYNAITEGRRDWTGPDGKNRHYGWCGDFVTYLLEQCGIRDGTLLNRQSINGKWAPGDNLARIERWAKAHDAFVTLDGDTSSPDCARNAKTGDIIVFYRPDGDHIAIVESAIPLKTIDGNGWGGRVVQSDHPTLATHVRYIVNLDALPFPNCICGG